MDGSLTCEPMGARDASDWIFQKLYLGRMTDRMDRTIICVRDVIAGEQDAAQWFFIRYVDEGGIHLRIRVKPHDGCREKLRQRLHSAFAHILNQLHGFVPGDYFPMVAASGFEDQLERTIAAHNDVRIVESDYEPEWQKFGGPRGILVAEQLFARSSDIACAVLADDLAGRLSRKSLVPNLMAACHAAFLPGVTTTSFWREYAYYWLNGRSPAAEDWRETFVGKFNHLREQGIEIRHFAEDDGARAGIHVDLWRDALADAAAHYAQLGGTEAEVLCFNFAHLMNNRLGIAALEEAYMATLLEQAPLLAAA